MIEIQCSSCHTRYRIDERVLPADGPTFKCSRCGHVFTTDPLTAKKITPDSSSKPATPRAPAPRSDAKPRVTPAPAAVPSPTSHSEVPEPAASEMQDATGGSPAASESKPAPLKPYIRNPRPTVFDRAPEPPPPDPALEPAVAIDPEAVARMRASVEAPRLNASAEAEPREKKPSRTISEPSRTAKNNQPDDEGENLEFDFSDEREPELGPELPDDDDDSLASPQRWSVGDDEVASPKRQSFGGEPDPEFSRGEPAPIGRGTIAQYAAIASTSIQPSEPLPDDRAYLERTELHSSRSFLGLFLVAAVLFLIATGIIHGVPSAGAELMRQLPVIGEEFVEPVALENQLSITDVQSSYQTVKGGHQALVVAGVVKNNSSASFHTVQIVAQLLDAAQHDLASSAVYCGTSLSPRMIGEMTPHELEFLQQLEPPKAFILDPGHSAPFLMVLIDPPGNLSHFALSVAKVLQPATSSGQPASARP